MIWVSRYRFGVIHALLSEIRTTMQNFKMTRTLVLSGLLITGLLGNGAVRAFAGAGSFELTGSLNTARYYHTATLLANGEVLVTGGMGVNGTYLASAELYNPSKGKWTVTGSMSVGRVAFTATLLPNGEVLVAGGSGFNASCFATAELYNPSTRQWTPTGTTSFWQLVVATPNCARPSVMILAL